MNGTRRGTDGKYDVVGLDERVYRRLAAYCFDEAVCWPSQATVAGHLGVSQPTVSRSVARLVAQGRLAVTRRRSRLSGRWHCVYELLDGWRPVPARERMAIVRRSVFVRARELARRRWMNTNPKGSCEPWAVEREAARLLASIALSHEGASPRGRVGVASLPCVTPRSLLRGREVQPSGDRRARSCLGNLCQLGTAVGSAS